MAVWYNAQFSDATALDQLTQEYGLTVKNALWLNFNRLTVLF